MKNKTLYLINLETDLNSAVLSNNHEMILAFSKLVKNLKVYSVHVGRYEVPKNVSVFEIGGGNSAARLLAIPRIILLFFKIIVHYRRSIVFYHMNTIIAHYFSYFFHRLKIKQAIWYSHSSPDKYLIKASKFVDHIFTPIAGSYPLESINQILIGHGINSKIFFKITASENRSLDIISVGRISRIKKLDEIIKLISLFNNGSPQKKLGLTLVGPIEDQTYFSELRILSIQQNVKINYMGTLSRENLPKIFNKHLMYFMGTPKSLDKAAVEASFCGCIVLTGNNEVQRALGLNEFWPRFTKEIDISILRQMQLVLASPIEEIETGVQDSLIKSVQRNNLIAQVTKIIDNLEN